MSKMIYLDHAATTRTMPEAAKAMEPYLDIYYGNPSTIYEFGEKSRKAIERAREVIAGTLHARPEEIFFTSGGTESDNWALKEAVQLYERTHPGRKAHILTTPIEHHAILNSCEELLQMGCGVSYLKVDESGRVILREAEQEILEHEDACLLSVMYANNEIGTIEPIDEIGRLAKKRQLIFHTDAVQAYGHIPIHVQRDHIDMLSASAHKFGGPKGVGFLYIRSEINLPAFVHGGAQESNRRAGTENVPGIVGIGKAAQLAFAHLEAYGKPKNKILKGLSGTPDPPGDSGCDFDGKCEVQAFQQRQFLFPGNYGGSRCDFDGYAGHLRLFRFRMFDRESGGFACADGGRYGKRMGAGCRSNYAWSRKYERRDGLRGRKTENGRGGYAGSRTVFMNQA